MPISSTPTPLETIDMFFACVSPGSSRNLSTFIVQGDHPLPDATVETKLLGSSDLDATAEQSGVQASIHRLLAIICDGVAVEARIRAGDAVLCDGLDRSSSALRVVRQSPLSFNQPISRPV